MKSDLSNKGSFGLGAHSVVEAVGTQVAAGYRAMDERRAIKALLRP